MKRRWVASAVVVCLVAAGLVAAADMALSPGATADELAADSDSRSVASSREVAQSSGLHYMCEAKTGGLDVCWDQSSDGTDQNPSSLTDAVPQPTTSSNPATVPIPEGFSAALGSDNASIDISWTVPAGVDGIELHIAPASSPTAAFTQGFASSHTGSSGGVMHAYQAEPSEIYAVKVRSYRSGSGASKVYSEWADSVTVAVPPEMEACFLVPDRNDGPDRLRCFWTNAAGAAEYELEVKSISSGGGSLIAKSISTVSLQILQTPSFSSSASIYKDISNIDESAEYEVRVRVKSPTVSAWSESIPAGLEKLLDLYPRCDQTSAEANASGQYPVRCYVPYFNKAVLNIYETVIVDGEETEQVQASKTVNGGVVDTIFLAPGSYTARWRFFSGSTWSPIPTNSKGEVYDNLEVIPYDLSACSTSIPMQSPLTSHNDITSSYMFRFHPIYKVLRIHTGTDMGGPYGLAVKAAHNGFLTKVSYTVPTVEGGSGYGNYIALRYHESEDSGGTCWHSFYGHLLSPQNSNCTISDLPVEGDFVRAGDTIGCVGSTGGSSGPHLHFETRHGDNDDYAEPNFVSPVWPRREPLEFLFPSQAARGESLLAQNAVKMGCPFLEADSGNCAEATKKTAAAPVVWCSSTPSSVTWNWSEPQGVAEFRTSASAAADLSGWSSRTDVSDRALTSAGNPGERLTLYVQAKLSSDVFWSWSGAASCTVKPRAIEVLCSATASSIVWAWTKPASAAAHEISFDESSWSDQSQGSKTLSGLSAGEEKTLFVRAREAGDEHWSWSGSKSCTTIPAAPAVSCTATAHSITWTWPAVTGATKYRTGNRFLLSPWAEQTRTSKSLTGLLAGSTQLLYVQAGNDSGWSGSGGAACTTIPAAPDVSCTSTSSSITWTWPAVTGATMYRTSYNASTWSDPQTTRSKTSSGLSSGTTLTLYVQAGNTSGWSLSDSAACTVSSSPGK